ncbi:hypothetical protein DL95DRAFT_498407 [Leptodontidium sp. 2 PMI_412]|nr:hypothetical protein DL95DRAFT_498407 [Leptodontidium sp. 2 PMI_412]
MESINKTYPCDQLESLTSLILAVSTSQVNVTTQIQSCPDLCSLAPGAGNPDFSGVGANLSWIIQAVLVFLLGPYLIIGVWLDHRFIQVYPLYPDSPRNEAIHTDFLGALRLVTVPVTLASLIYLRNVTFLFEVTYLYYLNAMQFLSLLSATFSCFVFDAWEYNHGGGVGIHPERENRRFRKKIAVVFCVLALAFYLGVTIFISRSRLSFPFLPDITAACRAYSNIIPKLPKHVEVPPANCEWLTSYLESLMNMPPSRGKGAFITGQTFAVVFACYILVLLLLQMHIDRNLMRDVIGEAYIDDQWGFGQILSVFLWTQILWLISKWIFSTVKRVRGVPSIRRLSATVEIAYELSHRTDRSTVNAAHGCPQCSNLEEDSECITHGRLLALGGHHGGPMGVSQP